MSSRCGYGHFRLWPAMTTGDRLAEIKYKAAHFPPKKQSNRRVRGASCRSNLRVVFGQCNIIVIYCLSSSMAHVFPCGLFKSSGFRNTLIMVQSTFSLMIITPVRFRVVRLEMIGVNAKMLTPWLCLIPNVSVDAKLSCASVVFFMCYIRRTFSSCYVVIL